MQTLEIIKLYYDSFNRGDMKTFISLLDENIRHDLNQGDSIIGKPQFESFMERMNRCYKEHIKELFIMTSNDNKRAAAEYVVEGTYFATDTDMPPAKNQKYTLPGGAFFSINNGKIIRVTNYYNLTEWFKQVETS
ncbi:MAG: ketosteroid isomerase-related protein [Pseudomonadota bacterium]